eukprot:CAMPEP_0114118990 /NCGR_PEP_ID=MMETSP0043_2-20121206/5874_1 /TAXON_ID=464988 /ORGANISM="Hemiselmis andersenii, Strain CCMP644" /LENGTH=40 /DNA_ID= /DNA_START= /DNA_END= /DNA_ORIENTATION=
MAKPLAQASIEVLFTPTRMGGRLVQLGGLHRRRDAREASW